MEESWYPRGGRPGETEAATEPSRRKSWSEGVLKYVQGLLSRAPTAEITSRLEDVSRSGFYHRLAEKERGEVDAAIVRDEAFGALRQLRGEVSSWQGPLDAYQGALSDLLVALSGDLRLEVERRSAAEAVRARYSNKDLRSYRQKGDA